MSEASFLIFKSLPHLDTSPTNFNLAAMPHPKVTYAEGCDTDIPVSDNSVDLLTVAEAAHYFDFDGFLKEANRVLKPSGTIAFWGYFNFEIKDHENVSKLINDFNVNFLVRCVLVLDCLIAILRIWKCYRMIILINGDTD